MFLPCSTLLIMVVTNKFDTHKQLWSIKSFFYTSNHACPISLCYLLWVWVYIYALIGSCGMLIKQYHSPYMNLFAIFIDTQE